MRDKKNLWRFGSKTLALTIALTLIICCTAGGTVAYLIKKAEPLVNTFTIGDINITLTEGDDDGNGDPDENQYRFGPDAKINKQAIVTVKAGSEACWLFAKVTESEKFGDYLKYDIASDWTALPNSSGVYYREVAVSDTDQLFNILSGDNNQVTAADGVTQEMLDALGTEGNPPFPTLTFKVYAVQKDAELDTAEKAWSKIK